MICTPKVRHFWRCISVKKHPLFNYFICTLELRAFALFLYFHFPRQVSIGGTSAVTSKINKESNLSTQVELNLQSTHIK